MGTSITQSTNTAERLVDALVPSARRRKQPPHELPWEMQAITGIAGTTGSDVIVDSLMLRPHPETAYPRGGALGLRLMDLDAENGLVLLREKGETLRWQPINHPAPRQASHRARPQPRRATTRRRITALPQRPANDLPPLRPPVETPRRTPAMDRRPSNHHPMATPHHSHPDRTQLGYGIARAYAGHTDNTGPATTTYIKTDLHAVAAALAVLTSEPHPLAISLDDLGFATTS